MTPHPYDGNGSGNCVQLPLGVLFAVFGLALISTLFGAPIEGDLQNGLAFGGVVCLIFGGVLLVDMWDKTFNRETIKPFVKLSDNDFQNLGEIAHDYWKTTVRRKLSAGELSGLSDSIYTDGGFNYHYSHHTGQMYQGLQVEYSVYVDRYGDVVAAGYHLPLIGYVL